MPLSLFSSKLTCSLQRMEGTGNPRRNDILCFVVFFVSNRRRCQKLNSVSYWVNEWHSRALLEFISLIEAGSIFSWPRNESFHLFYYYNISLWTCAVYTDIPKQFVLKYLNRVVTMFMVTMFTICIISEELFI